MARVGASLPTAVVREARQNDYPAAHRDPRRDPARLSNAHIEQVNTQIRLIARRSFGFHSPQALIALAMIKLADLCPPLPR